MHSKIEWNWKDFEYTLNNIENKNKPKIRIDNNYLLDLYNRSIYIFNNGIFYCFFTTFKSAPKFIFMALSDEKEKFAIENNIKFMNREQLNSIIEMIKEDNKPYGFGTMIDENEQIKIEKNLKISDCYTFKEQNRLFDEMVNNKSLPKNFDINKLKRFVRSYVYEIRFEKKKIQEK